mgnify:CR=1 FL=1
MVKPILHSLNSGGSGFGMSYYGRWAQGCPKRATLDTAAAIKYEPGSSDDNDAFGLGRLLHAYLELHYKRGVKGIFDTAAVKFSGSYVHDEHRVKAEAIFRAYRINHGPLELGAVLEVEKGYPENKKQAQSIEEVVGVSPYTFKPDMVIRSGRRDMARLQKVYRCILPKPGKYLVDHKSEGGEDASTLDRYLNRLQFTAYMLGYNAIHVDDPCLGLIVNVLKKTQGFGVRRVYVPLPSPEHIKALHAFLRYCVTMMKTMGDWPVPSEYNCWPRNRVCYWRTTGDCKGY